MDKNGLEEMKEGLINNKYITDINLSRNLIIIIIKKVNNFSNGGFKILNEILLKNNKIQILNLFGNYLI